MTCLCLLVVLKACVDFELFCDALEKEDAVKGLFDLVYERCRGHLPIPPTPVSTSQHALRTLALQTPTARKLFETSH